MLYERGYVEAITPHIYKTDVWKISGHYDFYGENMYFFNIDEGDGRVNEYAVKPMNCPGHVLIFGNDVRSLPRPADADLRVRHGVPPRALRRRARPHARPRLHAGRRAHLLHRRPGPRRGHRHARPRRLRHGRLRLRVLGRGLHPAGEVHRRRRRSGSWPPRALIETLEERGIPFEINEGDGAFYGPKIDIKLKDAIGRTWQCSTIQVDFNFPARFGLTYRTAENTEAQPFMLHRTILGSMERFFGILIEHYAGAFPAWLAPVQAVVIPIADRHLEYAYDGPERALQGAGVRVEVYDDNEPMRVKIAKAQGQKVPYMLVVGDKEAEDGLVAVRERTEGDIGQHERRRVRRGGERAAAVVAERRRLWRPDLGLPTLDPWISTGCSGRGSATWRRP